MMPRLIPGTKAHQDEVEAHLVEELDDLLAMRDDCPLVELLHAFARCAGAILGGILCQLDERHEEPVDEGVVLNELHRQLREVREVGFANWTGRGA